MALIDWINIMLILFILSKILKRIQLNLKRTVKQKLSRIRLKKLFYNGQVSVHPFS